MKDFAVAIALGWQADDPFAFEFGDISNGEYIMLAAFFGVTLSIGVLVGA